MEKVRKPFQGVLNIIRFNWHFYAIAFSLVFIMCNIIHIIEKPYASLVTFTSILVVASIIISLIVSMYIYDISGLYRLNWITQNHEEKLIVNINAGFDETSDLLQKKFKNAALITLDFYNPKKHTEISIKRARKAYPSFPKTKPIIISNTMLSDNSVDKIFVLLAAHEIRDEIDKIVFFKELNRIIKPNGQIYVTEHLRNFPNLLAYNIGFFHFYSKPYWNKVFANANLETTQEIKITPFILTFILKKNGNTL